MMFRSLAILGSRPSLAKMLSKGPFIRVSGVLISCVTFVKNAILESYTSFSFFLSYDIMYFLRFLTARL